MRAMTTPTSARTETPDSTDARKKRLKPLVMSALALAAALLSIAAYAVRFGGCDMESKFCYLSAAGTRSEVVVAWLDGFEVYTQTHPGE